MIKASSLYETVLSIAIIAIVITLATLIYANVTFSFSNISRYQLIEKIDSLKNLCDDRQDFTKKVFLFKQHEIHQSCVNFENNKNLMSVTFSVIKNNGVIEEKSYLIRRKY